MRAVVITQPGGPEVLRLEEVPDPVPGPGEVLVDIAAAGLNRADVMQRQGLLSPAARRRRPTPGMECSGRIIELGPDVTGWQVGDEVCALLGGGAYAEQVAVPQGQLLPVPDGVSLADAAALPEAACTIQGTVYQQARLAPGETYLVHGGAGGMGTFAIQIGEGGRRTVACTAGPAGEAGPLPRTRRRPGHLLPGRRLRRHHAEIHRRARRRRHPGRHGRPVPGQETSPRWPPGDGW